MKLEDRITALAKLGKALERVTPEMEEVILRAYHYNKWFTEDNTRHMLKAVVAHFLNEDKLRRWLKAYNIPDEPTQVKTIGLVMAGNVPLVGFHDLLCVLISGNKAQVKLSSKDQYLIPFIAKKLIEIAPEFGQKIEYTEILKGFDAVIATGSNNSARYFDQYFGKYPHIIRRNRNSVAVLDGKESPEELYRLGEDLFRYYGLGCRNVSKIFVPAGYDLTKLLDALEPYAQIMDQDKYKNNYDYNRTLLMMNHTPHLASDFLMVKEDPSIHSSIAVLHYEYYDDIETVKQKLAEGEQQIQCVVADTAAIPGALPLGHAQSPELWDYADKVDTMEFLLKL